MLVLIVAALLTIGVVMVSSAGLTVSSVRDVAPVDVLLSRPAMLAVLALFMMLAGSRVPIERLARASGLASPVPWILGAIFLLLVAVHVPGVGREVNGARRWIDLGFVGFQPSEAAKCGLIVALAWYAARQGDAMVRLGRGFLAPIAVVAAVCALVGTEDLGTAVLIGAAGLGLLVAGGARLTHAALLAPAAAAGIAAAVLASPYRIDRLRAFLDPYQDPQGIGYHLIQSLATVSGGGIAGRGLGNSIQKFGYLPEDTTDFVFAIICEELGLAGAAAVIFLFGALLVCGLSIVRGARSPFARLLGAGILLTIGLQALINMAVVTGLAPTKGIALPLVSAGGTGWAMTAFCIGLLAAIGREADAARQTSKGPDRYVFGRVRPAFATRVARDETAAP